MNLSPLSNNLFALLFLAAVMHSFYLAVLLLFKSQKERGLGWLGLMMIPLSMLLLTYLLFLTNVMRTNPHLLGIFVPFFYLIGPAYYFFVRRSLEKCFSFRWLKLLHLIPSFYIIWEWYDLYFWSAADKLSVIEYVYEPNRSNFIDLLLNNLNTLILLAYVLYLFNYLNNYLKNTSTNPARAKWLKKFSAIFAVFLITKLFLIGLFWVFEWPGVTLELILVLLLAGAIHLLGYIVLGKDKILPQLKNEKYATSPLEKTKIALLQQNIVEYLDTQRPWLKASFSIEELSSSTHIPRHHISQVLNEGLQLNFSDLVRQYRIEEVKRRLQNGEAKQYSIVGIASECGFGSKSSFHRAFKKTMGITPTAWLKTLQLDSISHK